MGAKYQRKREGVKKILNKRGYIIIESD